MIDREGLEKLAVYTTVVGSGMNAEVVDCYLASDIRALLAAGTEGPGLLALADKWDREAEEEFPGAISGHAQQLRHALGGPFPESPKSVTTGPVEKAPASAGTEGERHFCTCSKPALRCEKCGCMAGTEGPGLRTAALDLVELINERSELVKALRSALAGGEREGDAMNEDRKSVEAQAEAGKCIQCREPAVFCNKHAYEMYHPAPADVLREVWGNPCTEHGVKWCEEDECRLAAFDEAISTTHIRAERNATDHNARAALRGSGEEGM